MYEVCWSRLSAFATFTLYGFFEYSVYWRKFAKSISRTGTKEILPASMRLQMALLMTVRLRSPSLTEDNGHVLQPAGTRRGVCAGAMLAFTSISVSKLPTRRVNSLTCPSRCGWKRRER